MISNDQLNDNEVHKNLIDKRICRKMHSSSLLHFFFVWATELLTDFFSNNQIVLCNLQKNLFGVK